MSPAKCSTASACNNPSDNITEIRYFGTVRLLRPKQNKVLYVNMEYIDLLPPTAPSLVFAREICTPYCNVTEDRWKERDDSGEKESSDPSTDNPDVRRADEFENLARLCLQKNQ